METPNKVVRVSDEQFKITLLILKDLFLVKEWKGDIGIFQEINVTDIEECLKNANIQGYQISE